MALTFFTIRKSLFGRLLGISSTGGLVMGVRSTGGPLVSTDVNLSAQMWGPGIFKTATDGQLLPSAGISLISSDSTSGSTYFMAAPVKGVRKEIFIFTSATSMSLQTTAASNIFQWSSLHFGATVGSSIITFLSASATQSGGVIQMVGLSTTQWYITKKPAWVTT